MFFFNDPAPTEIYTLSLHDALPISRLTHTLEAAGIARGVARALRLNEDLTEAIAVGHDVGHPPFGHAGEQALDGLLRQRGLDGFRHNEHSPRVVERPQRGGRGRNLPWAATAGRN